MTPLDFSGRHLGQRLTSPGGLGGQCTDLANLWLLEAYGFLHVYHNAVDWSHVSIPRHQWTANLPENFPGRGCLVVWGPSELLGIGQFGHIALCLVADVMHFVSLDQNWPDGAPASLRLHEYRAVLGWQAPL